MRCGSGYRPGLPPHKRARPVRRPAGPMPATAARAYADRRFCSRSVRPASGEQQVPGARHGMPADDRLRRRGDAPPRATGSRMQSPCRPPRPFSDAWGGRLVEPVVAVVDLVVGRHSSAHAAKSALRQRHNRRYSRGGIARPAQPLDQCAHRDQICHAKRAPARRDGHERILIAHIRPRPWHRALGAIVREQEHAILTPRLTNRHEHETPAPPTDGTDASPGQFASRQRKQA